MVLQALDAATAQVRTGRVAAMGLSAGGGLAALLAFHHAERFDAVVTVAAPPLLGRGSLQDPRRVMKEGLAISPTLAALHIERCAPLLADLEELESSVQQSQSSPRGLLRVAGPQTFSELHLASPLRAFLARYPELEVELVLTDRLVDLVEQGFDVALRIGELEDSRLLARRLAREEGILAGISAGANVFAAKKIAERLGTGKTVVTVICDTGERYLSVNM